MKCSFKARDGVLEQRVVGVTVIKTHLYMFYLKIKGKDMRKESGLSFNHVYVSTHKHNSSLLYHVLLPKGFW